MELSWDKAWVVVAALGRVNKTMNVGDGGQNLLAVGVQEFLVDCGMARQLVVIRSSLLSLTTSW